MYIIKTSGSKGLGVFAKSFIPRGTRIFSEKPLLAIRADQDAGDIFPEARLLSVGDRRRLMELSSHVTRELRVLRWGQAVWYSVKQLFSGSRGAGKGRFLMPKIGEHVAVLGIFRNNAFNLGTQSLFQQAVFPRISRINHSCIPNAQGNFHDMLGKFNIHATRDIEVDEELTLNYLQEHGAVREARQNKLLGGYGFQCECPACDLSSSQGVAGEERRVQMHEDLVKFIEDAEVSGEKSVKTELSTIEAFIKLLEGEGIAGRELSTLYLEAAKLNEKLGNRTEALHSAERGLEIDQDCLGVDHPLYLDSLKVVQALKENP